MLVQTSIASEPTALSGDATPMKNPGTTLLVSPLATGVCLAVGQCAGLSFGQDFGMKRIVAHRVPDAGNVVGDVRVASPTPTGRSTWDWSGL